MTVYRIDPYVPFLSSKITAQCTKMWRKLFAVAREYDVSADWGDIAFWVTHANSGSIRLRLRSTNEDDEDPEWESPPLIATGAEGLCEALNSAKTRSALAAIKENFYDWSTTAILKSFHSVQVQRLLQKYNHGTKPFSIFWAKHERSFSESNLILLWGTEGGPMPADVKKTQSQARQGKRYKAVKKKSPTQLKTEGRARTVKRKRT